MKLVDILARELKVWPEGVRIITQQGSGYLFDEGNYPLDINVEVAEDGSIATVTRAQWQAAVDVLKKAENAVPEWNGEGLPPVGTVCEVEVATDTDSMDKRPEGWHRTTILAHYAPYGDEFKVAICPVDRKIYQRIAECFRPIRTPEQIAKQERSKACDKMYGVILDKVAHDRRNNGSDICEALYDAGYRKFEIVDN